jgi:16S rRNA (cytosine967-C5)-methyltransferase
MVSRQRHEFVQSALDNLAAQQSLIPADRGLSSEIARGVIRRQATLDAVLSGYVARRRGDVEPGLWTLLQLGLYQLLFLDQVPPHAAVHETVQVARQLQRPQWASVVNGVLRTISQKAQPISAAEASVRAVDRLPVDSRSGETPISRGWQFDRPLFPDPLTHLTEYVAKVLSYPRRLVQDWLDRYGPDEAVRLCRWFNGVPPMTLRCNRLRSTAEQICQRLAAAGIESSPGTWPELVRLHRPAAVTDLPGFAEGWFSVQDESAMQAAWLIDPCPGLAILDLCAAPGGKTTHLAELTGDRGHILAVDVDEGRLERVRDNARRLGLQGIITQQVSADGHDLPEGPFDRVLVDVPCSNTGVLGKRPEARWRLSALGIESLLVTQERLLRQGLARLRPGGLLVYSTCSIDPRENAELVARVLTNHPDVGLVREVDHRPGLPGDGGYQALIRRAGDDRGTNSAI